MPNQHRDQRARTTASQHRRRRPALAAALTAVTALLAACTGTNALDAEEFSVRTHVAHLAAPQEPGVIGIGDLDTASDLAGVQRPEDATADGSRDWLLALASNTQHEVFVPVPSQFVHTFGQPGGDELGWDLTDVRTFAHYERPPQQSLVVTGDFDDDTLAADLEDLGEGVYSAGSGPDLSADLQQTTALRPTGTPLRLARDGDVIMVDVEEQAVRDWVTGAERATAADDEAVLDVAVALDDQDVYAAAILTRAGPLQLPPGVGDSGAEQLTAQWQDWAITEPFEVVGIGWAMADGEPVVAVAYHFADPGSAERAVDQVRTVWTDGLSMMGQPISDMFIVDGVAQQDAVVTARLHLGDSGVPQHVYDMIQRQDVTVGYLQP